MVEIDRHSSVDVPNDKKNDENDVSTDRIILNDSFRLRSPNDKKTDENDEFIDNDIAIKVNARSKGQEMDSKLRKAIRNFINNPVVENGSLALIAINSITIGVCTFDFIYEDEQILTIFNWSDLIFLIIFTVELGLTIFYLRWKFFTDIWVVFDSVIIILSWIFTGGRNQSVQIIRSLRIFRILPRIESLKSVLSAFGESLPKLGCLAVFQFIIMFIFGIYFTETLG